jgi:hypothetical protein
MKYSHKSELIKTITDIRRQRLKERDRSDAPVHSITAYMLFMRAVLVYLMTSCD